MQKFSGLAYIEIAIANAYGHGLDKKLWEERIEWATDYLESGTKQENLDACAEGDEPLLMRNAINAYYNAIEHKPTGFLMSLDATASGKCVPL